MPASKILMGVPAYGYISSSSATTLVHKRDQIPGTGGTKSLHHQWYEDGQARARQAKRKNINLLAKRAGPATDVPAAITPTTSTSGAIFCAGNHSGQPCPGVVNQTISKISWNPMLNNLTLTNGSVSGNGGVFIPGSGVGKLGNGDLGNLVGNQINFNALISNGVLAWNGQQFAGTNGYVKMWDSCSSTVRFIPPLFPSHSSWNNVTDSGEK